MAKKKKKKDIFVKEVATMEGVEAIGQTGDPDEVPIPGFGDYDLFVLCSKIPSMEERISCYNRQEELFTELNMEVCKADIHWGTGDILLIDGVETMFMYFLAEEMRDYINSVVDGSRISPEGEFYPLGRLSTMRNINVLVDKTGVLEAMKEELTEYPERLRKAVLDASYPYIWDEENVGRAVLRKDIVFNHHVFQHSLDLFLQTLYALNKVYFPSWKRTEQYIHSFPLKPRDCYSRMQKAIALSVCAETIEESYAIWRELVEELKEIVEEKEINNQ